MPSTVAAHGRQSGATGSVGISAHLPSDAQLSSTWRGFSIQGFSGLLSELWLLGTLGAGLGVPLSIAKRCRSFDRP